ncbi:MAG: 4-hydroxy-3-methylbut-2-enyl diphosphate reductase [Phycisphaeraceae bacterium]|nr:4-hydroxy-3-methylbut-2-enyl diphosphate reductase [Phycisphaeraceae bacterium]MBX3409093.1 4-hydroxy-3-methylbut-2-enyl diphosphate reductase [Phycisphaeraceae bacterium]
MHLILVNPRGFCAGVRMAIDVVDQVIGLFPGERVYVYHEIVHNKHVVDRFIRKGVTFVESLDEVPKGSIVVFSAHGISPAVRAEARSRGLTAIDATCPLVTKVHAEAVRYARQGYQILLVGHKDHQEVIGTLGEAPDATQVVESPEDIPHLQISDASKLVYLTQTTLSTDDATVIINALKAAFPNIKEPPSSDICYATTNRQHAVRTVGPECDATLVIGSKNSSNSVRLTEISRNIGVQAYLIDDVSEIDWSWFATGQERVLVTAGASAPEDLVAEVCRTLLERFGGSIEQRNIFDEDIEFAPPGALRKIMETRGIDPESYRFRAETPVITPELYGAVPMTISAPRCGSPA